MKGNLIRGNLRGIPCAALIAGSLMVTGFSGALIAQDESALRLEEVIVTARKREESIQDVPVAVTALTPGQLERGSIMRSTDISKMAPNVELHETYIGSESLSATIRGIGYDDIEKSIEPTVGVAIDGVFMATNSGGVFDMFDVASVEVLRGPQGTLFGRNTTGGVISVKRTEPTGEFGAKVEATLGDENLVDIKGVFNMPLGERGGVKVALKKIESESHVFNTTLNERRDFRDSQSASVTVKYDFTESTSAKLTYDDYDHDTIAPDNLLLQPFGEELTGYLASQNDSWKTSPQLNPLEAYMDGSNITFNLIHAGDGYEIKYIFGRMDYDEEVHESSWGSSIVFFEVNRDQTFEQTSHELQITSDLDGPFNYVAGIYSLEADSYITSGPIQPFTATHIAEAEAVYGEVVYDVNDDWSITLGARYTDEKKAFDSLAWAPVAGNADRLANNVSAATLDVKPRFSDENLTYRLVLQREFEKGMMYASFSTGYRSGGFFNRGTSEAEVAPYASEEVENLELGIRANPSENSQINLTVFSMDYTDKQIEIITAASDPDCGKGGAAEDAAGITCSFVRNAGQISIDGFELEGILMPTDALTLRATVGVLDSNFDMFDYNGTNIADRAQLLYAPDLTMSFGMEHSSEFMGGLLTVTGAMSFQDEVYTQTPWGTYDPLTYPKVTIDSWESLDISATYLLDTANGTLKIRVYGTDVLEEGNRVQRRYTTGSFTWAELAPRRQIGVSLGYEF